MFVVGIILAIGGYCSVFIQLMYNIDPLMWHHRFYATEYDSLIVLLAGIYLAWWGKRKTNKSKTVENKID